MAAGCQTKMKVICVCVSAIEGECVFGSRKQPQRQQVSECLCLCLNDTQAGGDLHGGERACVGAGKAHLFVESTDGKTVKGTTRGSLIIHMMR